MGFKLFAILFVLIHLATFRLGGSSILPILRDLSLLVTAYSLGVASTRV